MAGWNGSTRREELPPDWDSIRRRVLRRDNHRCVWKDQYGRRCNASATDVDHIVRGDDHRESNLRSLCSWHHAKRTGADGGAAKAAARRQNNKKFRREEQHPGLL